MNKNDQKAANAAKIANEFLKIEANHPVPKSPAKKSNSNRRYSVLEQNSRTKHVHFKKRSISRMSVKGSNW